MNRTLAFAHDQEQSLFRDSLRKFLQSASPTSRVRQVMAGADGFDPSLWKRMAEELALPGMAISERKGGAGFGWVELCIAAEETGHALAPSPFFATSVMAVAALNTIAPEDALLVRLAMGEVRAALAILEGSAGWMSSGFASSVDQGRLSGTKSFVIDGATAQVFLVIAMDGEGIGLFEVESSEGLARQSLAVIDPTRRIAQLSFAGAPVRKIGRVSMSDLERVLDLCAIALANEMVGGISRLFEETLAYTKLRVQFGRSVASFQAIKHRMAELLLQVELARSAAYYAAQAVDAGLEGLSWTASLAKATVSDAYLFAAQEAIQLHGGIGFTWDHDVQLWFKRAKSSEVLLGTSAWHRDRMISALASKELRGGVQS
ncbi:MAG: acyl-CoA dehydrogenase [Gammaproteobacteria bacterium]|nr:acyl-CoA dehydrogenase [Gammaproteobacteria bacterium]